MQIYKIVFLKSNHSVLPDSALITESPYVCVISKSKQPQKQNLTFIVN